MTATTLTLTDFLLARIAEDEHRAKQAWAGGYRGSRWLSEPDRQLAECEAKRRIVEWCSEREMIWVGRMSDDPNSPRPEQFVPGGLKASPEEVLTLRFLAAVYADHPDFRDEWRP